RPRDDVLDELEQHVVGPVEILDHEDERTLQGNGLEKGTPRREGLVATRSLLTLTGSDEPGELGLDPGALAAAFEERLDGCRELLARGRGSVRFGEAGMRFHDRAQRPQRDSLAVREAASLPPVHELGLRVDVVAELGDEAGLADTRFAHERDEMAGRLAQRP